MSAAEATRIPRIALTATAAKRISFEFFTVAPNRDGSPTNQNTRLLYGEIPVANRSRAPTEFGRMLQNCIAQASEGLRQKSGGSVAGRCGGCHNAEAITCPPSE